MIGIDTNILVRYITHDDPRQAKLATETIEKMAESGEKFLIQPIVLCELVWVLNSAYGYAKADILFALDRLLRTVQFEFADKDALWRAFGDYGRGRADFSDYYIGRANENGGAATTLTFDKSLAGLPRFQVL